MSQPLSMGRCLLASIIASGALVSHGALAAPAISKVYLINADTNKPFKNSSGASIVLVSGMTIDLGKLPTKNINLQAILSDANKAVFYWDGVKINEEGSSPYAAWGDRSGDFKPYTPTVGTHTFQVRPYKNTTSGSSKSFTLKVVNTTTTPPPTVSKLTLINADTDKPMLDSAGAPITITDGMKFDLAKLPTRNLNIDATLSNATKITFVYDGGTPGSESSAPYAIFGDSGGGFNAWVPTVGLHKLSIKAATSSTTGVEQVFNFEVADSGTTAPPVEAPETGWTELKPSSDSRIVYVSTMGSDTNNGLSQETPVKTPERALELVRTGYPDWILFRRGDVFDSPPRGRSGRSVTEPFVIGAYGEGPRPTFNVDITEQPLSACGSHRTFVSLHLKSYRRDPTAANFNPALFTTYDDGVRCVYGTVANILFEDLLVEYFRKPFSFDGGSTRSHTNIRFRRNVIKNSWAAGDGVRNYKSQGMYITMVKGLTLEENMFYMNGWNPSIPKAERNYLNHNVYVNDIHDLVIRRNISALSSSLGFKINAMKTYGSVNVVIEDNFVIGSANGVTVLSNDKIANAYKNVRILNNVHTHIGARANTDGGSDVDQAMGSRIAHIENLEASGNIYVDKNYSTTYFPAMEFSAINGTKVVKNNRVHDYSTASNPITGASDSSNWLEGTDSELVDPSRTIDGYFGVADGAAHLYREMVKQRKGAWNQKVTAPAINDYFREGISKR